jgi:hypothetical protein
VFISFTPDALDFTNLQPEFPIPPGTRWSYGAVDSAYEGYHSVTAPGSLQDFSFDRFCIGYFICSDGTPDRMVKLTYQTPGDYVIDYSDFYRMSVYYTYLLVWVDDVETGGYFTVFSPGFLQSTDSGSSGSFALTVAAVPEISTWMMMLLGFAGIGLLAYRRRNGHSFKAA